MYTKKKVHNPSFPCTCTVNTKIDGDIITYSIKYCSTHAAAPELLEALENLLAWANIGDKSNSVSLRDECRAIINRAKGE